MKDILLFSNNVLIFEGLKTILSREKDLQICGWARSMAEQSDKYEKYMPEIVLVDDEMITNESCHYFSRLKSRGVSAVLLVSRGSSECYDWQDGTIPAKNSAVDMIESIRCLGKNNTEQDHGVGIEKISLPKREMVVLRLLISGETVTGIAEKLFISEHTVKKHISNIYRKLEVKNRGQAITKALRMGLIHDL